MKVTFRCPALAMPKVLIVTDQESGLLGEALKQAILLQSDIGVTTIDNFDHSALINERIGSEDTILCPLTLKIPSSLKFPQQAVYRACADITGLRQRVEELHVPTGEGKFWLPIVLTSKGVLYAEAITLADQGTASNAFRYLQPFHLSDRYRQPLYALGQRLLKLISATPAAYLMQFGFAGETVFFDRLFPFPAAPAIASLNVQSPNLFACHWRCLSDTPILDLTIAQSTEHQVFQPLLSNL